MVTIMERPPLSEEMIEKLRRSGLRLDREGRFWHEGAEVTHERFRQTLLKWLDLLPDGRPILRLDDTRYAYLDVDDALLLVTSLRWEDDRAIVSLNDGSSEELCYDSLEQGPEHAMYCRVRDARLRARITTPAYYKLAEHIDEQDGHFVLHCRAGEVPIQNSSDS